MFHTPQHYFGSWDEIIINRVRNARMIIVHWVWRARTNIGHCVWCAWMTAMTALWPHIFNVDTGWSEWLTSRSGRCVCETRAPNHTEYESQWPSEPVWMFRRRGKTLATNGNRTKLTNIVSLNNITSWTLYRISRMLGVWWKLNFSKFLHQLRIWKPKKISCFTYGIIWDGMCSVLSLFLLFQIGRCLDSVQQSTLLETHPDRC